MVLLDQFTRLAEDLAERLAAALAARVLVRDGQGALVAGSEPGALRLPVHTPHFTTGPVCVRTPVTLAGQPGEVLVVPLPGDGTLPAHLALAIIRLTLAQTAGPERLPNQAELKDKFIHDLLRGMTGDEAEVLRDGQILGMDLTRPRAVILVDAADFILGPDAGGDSDTGLLGRSRMRTRAVIAGIVRFFALPSDAICAYIGNGEIAVLKASSTQDLGPWSGGGNGGEPRASWANLTALKRAAGELLLALRRDTGASITIGIGRYHQGISGIARSYEDARAALSLGQRFHGRDHVHCLDQLGVAALIGISDERTKADLASHLLSPLDHEPELLRTLTTFFAENCCASTTAAALSIHRNTLSYRVEKVASLTGLDPRRFDDAVQIRLALFLRSLAGEAEPLCSCTRDVPHPAHSLGKRPMHPVL